MTQMNFIRSLTTKKKPVTESVDFETALLAQLERKVNKLSEGENPEDVIRVDVPLFMRLMEYAREDAKTDMDLHFVTDNLVKLSSQGRTLSMADYDQIIGQQPTQKIEMPKKESTLDLSMIRTLAGISK